MTFHHLAILLPCDQIEDLSLQRREGEARQLLAGWLALWHPSLIRAAGNVPEWLAAGEAPEMLGEDDDAGYVFVLPACSRAWLDDAGRAGADDTGRAGADDAGRAGADDGWIERAEASGSRVVKITEDDSGLAPRLLELLDDPAPSLPDELVARFRDVGLAHLMIDLLTRQMLYMSNLDEEGFRQLVVDAAGLSDPKEVANKLAAAVDLLADAREYFYPVESHLMDLTLVADTTLGPPLREELERPGPMNLLITAALIERLAEQSPETLDLLREGLERRRVGLIGGAADERPLALMPVEAIRWHLRRGLDIHERLLHRRPTVFGQRTFALSPVLPQILHRLGFSAALHTSLAGGRFPVDSPSRVDWRGVHHQTIPALGRVPLDASRDAPLLHMAEQLGGADGLAGADTMDYDHASTQLLAHWPGQARPWCDSLRRLAKHERALGTFVTVDDYLEQTALAGMQKQYGPDDYRSPYLEQAVERGEPDAVSRWRRYFARRATLDAIGTWAVHAACLLKEDAAASDTDTLDELTAAVEDALPHPADDDGAIDTRLDAALHQAARRMAAAIGVSVPAEGHAGQAAGTLMLNPHAATIDGCPGFGFRYIAADTGETPVAPRQTAVTGETPVAPRQTAGTGETPVAPGGSLLARVFGRGKQKPPPPMAERTEDRIMLRNEHAEVRFDVHTGAIRAVSDYRTRGARLAQKVAMRIPDPRERQADSDAHYTIPAVDEWEIVSGGPRVGEVRCVGRLCDRQGQRVAGFEQRTRLARGSRVIELEITLSPERQPGPDPWRSYYAVRFAWSDAASQLFRSVNGANLPTDATRLEAPHFIDIRGGGDTWRAGGGDTWRAGADGGIAPTGATRTTLLCGGLPFHRRFGLRKLDTILSVRGEREQRFRLGVGIDLPHPTAAAEQLLRPPLSVPVAEQPPTGEGWLFHLDCRHATVTHWETCRLTADQPSASEERTGLRLRVLEVDGRRAEASLRAVRPIAWARKLGTADEGDVALAVHGDTIIIPLGPHEWSEIEAAFA